MSIKSRDIPRRQTCIPLFTKDLQMPFYKVPFYRAKGHLSHLKRASFTLQKGIFYFIKNHLLFSMYESLLQPFLCPFPFHNKRVSLPLHYYNNTIKTNHLSIFLSLPSLLPMSQHIDNKPLTRNVKNDSN